MERLNGANKTPQEASKNSSSIAANLSLKTLPSTAKSGHHSSAVPELQTTQIHHQTMRLPGANKTTQEPPKTRRQTPPIWVRKICRSRRFPAKAAPRRRSSKCQRRRRNNKERK
ncbi:hypothetical protein FXO38_26750 [Capsicum annuum]|nr:hypothetical protein FXO38_26750 [Capsicum annuum]KAF3649718.1 hypothetical protein FXO37_18816 [Capsicum annuum]